MRIAARERVPGRWEATLNLGYIRYPVYGGSDQYFDRVAPSEDHDRLFVDADGELLFTRYSSRNRDALFGDDPNTREVHLWPRLGIQRQTGSGFVFRAELGYYRLRYTYNLSDDLAPRPGELLLRTTDREDALTLGLMTQFTFLKRHRFQPFVGFGVMTQVAYHGESERFLLDGDDGRRHPVLRTRSRDYRWYPEMELSAGINYRVSYRLGLGAGVRLTDYANTFLEAPFTLEARYTLR